MQGQINAIKAASFDQITGLNNQISNLSSQLDRQNALIKQIVDIVSPDKPDLTIDELLAILRGAFAPVSGSPSNDGESTTGESEE